MPPEDDLRPQRLEGRALRGELRLAALVVGRHDGALRAQEPRRGDPAARHPDDQDAPPSELVGGARHRQLRGRWFRRRRITGERSLRVPLGCLSPCSAHLNFSVARLIKEKMSATIQKRVTTFVSSQPDSSKWW